MGRKSEGQPQVAEEKARKYLTLETINVTSANKHKFTMLKRKAHVQFAQEIRLNEGQVSSMKGEAAKVGKTMDAGPKDPEQLKTSAGVATIAMKDLRMYHVTRPIDDYKDAIATGRCRITCMYIDGCTLAVANLYGWTGGQIGTYEAERTDDLVAIVRKQFAALPPGPKAIVGT